MNIKDFMLKLGKELKGTKKEKPTKPFQNLSANEKWALVEKLLKDLGYIDS